ncbi:HU family DNA-binding protein [Paenibacillus medicaginis]|uniref:HU family DNA-binding protein n=1 Tax=Paenibacillus medicaginis TaxID=1470560 RepID=A0ABV5BUY1_9BACL
MNKQDIINEVVRIAGIQKKDAWAAVEAVFSTVDNALVNGEKVYVKGHGTYEVRARSARTGINPTLLKELKAQGVDEETAKEQAKIDIPASKAVAFKPAGKLKESVK